jgi:hypothetical protein
VPWSAAGSTHLDRTGAARWQQSPPRPVRKGTPSAKRHRRHSARSPSGGASAICSADTSLAITDSNRAASPVVTRPLLHLASHARVLQGVRPVANRTAIPNSEPPRLCRRLRFLRADLLAVHDAWKLDLRLLHHGRASQQAKSQRQRQDRDGFMRPHFLTTS